METVEEFKVLPAYAKLFYSKKPYYLLYGGRAGGKSTAVAAYFVIKMFDETEFFRGVVSRYTARSVKFSIYRDILDMIESWGLTQYVQVSGDEIRCTLNDNSIITHSMRLADGTMSAKGKGLSHVTHLIIDEAIELPSEEEYIKVVDTFREKGVERKIFVLFNPGSKRHWIHKRWFVNGKPNPKWLVDHEFIYTTYMDNLENLDQTKVAEWERAQFENPTYYKHHVLGEWLDGSEGQIFTDFSLGTPDPLGEYEVTYGLDFGFASDPTALVKVSKHNDTLYLEELIYDTGLTIPDLSKRLKLLGLTSKDRIVADSSDPRSIEELRRAGFTVQPAYKGPDSIRSGIEKIKRFRVFMDPLSTNLHAEVDLYSWDRDTDKPIDRFNHCIDAIRYALSTTGGDGRYAAVGGSQYSKSSYKSGLSKKLY